MSNAFTDLLAEKGTLLADGATGTNLFNMGLMSGDAPEMWNTEEPKKIIKLYRFAVDSGSDLFLTNSFGANASRLKLHGAEKRVHELSRVSAELAREVIATDEKVDAFYNSIFRNLVSHMVENPSTISSAAQMLFVARNLERIGDHATNVAEMVHFAATGTYPLDEDG